ncbi:MAG: class I SAM-dependent methyltransferase [Actinomycetota bacterium]
MERTRSLAFDRAVDYYDRTRSLSSETMARLVPLLTSELGSGPCIEIGVGTGRIALPMSEAGTAMIGLDLSAAMMHRLVRNAGGRLPFPLVTGDATRLPLADDSVRGALAIHVLHLIPLWPLAANELIRVVRPGGTIVVDLGRATKGPFRELLAEFSRAAGIPEQHRGVNDPAELDRILGDAGAEAKAFEPIVEARFATYEKTIAALEAGTYSVTWSADEATRSAAAQETRRWAARSVGDLDRRYDYRLEIALRSYRLPA